MRSKAWMMGGFKREAGFGSGEVDGLRCNYTCHRRSSVVRWLRVLPWELFDTSGSLFGLLYEIVVSQQLLKKIVSS
jgi:hypothetical protein